MRKFLAALVLVFALGTSAAAQDSEWEPGNIVITGGYCHWQNDEAMQTFMDRVESHGQAAYNAFMNHPRTPCWDRRLHGSPPVRFKLVEFLRRITPPGSPAASEMWRVQDMGGQLGYTWLPADRPDDYDPDDYRTPEELRKQDKQAI